MSTPAARLVLAALVLAGCRAFPVGLFAPEEVLDALERRDEDERLDEDELARAVAAHAGVAVERAARTSPERYWRLDAEPALGPVAPKAFEAPANPCAAGLASGDLVLVKNGRAQSLATTLAFDEFTFYDHAGVLVERDGRFFVLDSWPRFDPFVKAADFADRFRGGVRATSLGRFLAHYETLLAVRLPGSERNARLAAAALASLDEGIAFDPHHDPADPRLSCAEYLQLLLGRAGHDAPRAARAATGDAEFRTALAALGFPAAGFVVPDQFAALEGARPVAWISRHRTRAGARAIEAAFAVLHARFRAGGRVSDFLALDRFRFLRYRASVASFLGWAEGFAEARGLAERAELERELARLAPLFFPEPWLRP